MPDTNRVELGLGLYLTRRRDNLSGEVKHVLHVPSTFIIEVQGDLIENVKRSIIHNTPKKPDPRRPGYNLGIYDNCPLDEWGRPRRTEWLYDKQTGQHVATWIGVCHPDGTVDLGKAADHLTLTRPHDHQSQILEQVHDLEARVKELERLVSLSTTRFA